MDIKELEKLTAEHLEKNGYSLENFKLISSKANKTLEIVIDRVEPIDMNAIVEVTHSLNEMYDELDPFKDPYNLDISSLGAEKPLKVEQLDKYLNSYIHVHLINPIDGENIYEGDLVEVNKETIKLSYRIKTRTKTVEIIKTNISNIHLAIKF